MSTRTLQLVLVLVFFSLGVVCSNGQPQKFDVTRYGAVGDGMTDNTGAVAKAVTALLEWSASASGSAGADLYFPEGHYLLAGQPTSTEQAYIDLNLVQLSAQPGPITISGSGASKSIVSFDLSRAAGLRVAFSDITASVPLPGRIFDLTLQQSTVSSGSGRASPVITLSQTTNWAIQNMTLVGAGTATADCVGISLDTCRSTQITNVAISNAAVEGISVSRGADFVFDDISITSPASLAGGGIFIWRATGVTVKNSVLRGGLYGINVASSVVATDAHVLDVLDSRFLGNSLGVTLGESANVSITSSHFDGTGAQPYMSNPIAGVQSPPRYPGVNAGFITITESTFANLDNGITAGAGNFRVDSCTFTANQIAFAGNAPFKLLQPYQLTNNLFAQQTKASVVLDPASVGGFIIDRNTCYASGSVAAAPIQYKSCANLCVVDNNTGCTLAPTQMQRDTAAKATNKKMPVPIMME